MPNRCLITYYRNGEWTAEPPRTERYTTGATIRQSTENRYWGVVDKEGFVVSLVPSTSPDFMQFMKATVTQFEYPAESAA
jgi:hypothetical protein